MKIKLTLVLKVKHNTTRPLETGLDLKRSKFKLDLKCNQDLSQIHDVLAEPSNSYSVRF